METLEEQRAAVEDELRGIHEAAGDSALSEEQQAKWDELTAKRADIEAQVKARDERRAQVAKFAEKPGHVESGDGNVNAPKSPEFMRKVEPFDGADVRTMLPMVARDKALKALESRDLIGHLEQRSVDHMDRLLRKRTRNTDGTKIARRLLVTENEHYRSAFAKLVTLTQPVLTPEEARAVQMYDEYRAMSIGTDSAGGFGVPVLVAA